jgi:4-alpha-glucanotransferase
MTAASRRRAGLLIPLFSCPSSTSWGIGDIGDVSVVTGWLADAGLQVLQLLPINEMASDEQSPYSALSAMAIDPVFIRVTDVPEYAALGGEASLDVADEEDLELARRAPRIDYARIRPLKQQALRRAFERFRETEWSRGTVRAQELTTFVEAEAWWINDYALFRALHTREGHRPWTEWPEALRWRDQEALAAARHELATDILFRQYLQWIADSQWRRARAAARSNGVELFGDLPFMVDSDSADVWANQSDFNLDASLGVPPDAFSATGQDWGMPTYRWDVIAGNGYRWLRDRARRSAALYDGYRVDHLVGFYRTYSRPRQGGEPSFAPSTEPEQLQLGERILEVFREPGAEIVAEDLGVVPEFVRLSLARLGIPGFRVFRWEREWHVEGQPFRDPSTYPHSSVAVSGTHDTEPMAVWWEHTSADERRQIADLQTVQRLAPGIDLVNASYLTAVRDVLLETLFASGSDLLLLPIQDVFGWSDRINVPATVATDNWTFRLPWAIDRIAAAPDARERQRTVREWTKKHGR